MTAAEVQHPRRFVVAEGPGGDLAAVGPFRMPESETQARGAVEEAGWRVLGVAPTLSRNEFREQHGSAQGGAR